MFEHFLWSVVIVPPLFVAVVRLIAGRLEPALAARVLAWSAAMAAVAALANLAVSALHATEAPPAAGRAAVPWVSWLSVALVVAAGVAVTRRWLIQRRALRLAGRQAPPGGRVLLVAHDDPMAYAVPGRPGHVVVSTGMRDVLSARQFDALMAHERAHLAGGHHRLVRAVELAAAAHPGLRWATGQVGYLVERAADERAAMQVGNRRTVAHAIGAAALGATGGPLGLNASVPAGVVPRRVAALLRPRRRATPWALGALSVGLVAFTVVWTGEAIYDLRELIGLAHR